MMCANLAMLVLHCTVCPVSKFCQGSAGTQVSRLHRIVGASRLQPTCNASFATMHWQQAYLLVGHAIIIK